MSDATETPAVAEAAAVKRTKTRTKYDHATKTITVHEPHAAPVGYSMEELQPEMLHQLAVRGAAVYLTSAQDGHAAAWGRLTKGEYSQRKPAVEKPMSDWRLAIAHAAVEDTKKSEAPLTLDQAKVKAAALDADSVRARKVHPLVVKHYNKLKPAPAGSAAGSLL